jgi:hypothetical protein
MIGDIWKCIGEMYYPFAFRVNLPTHNCRAHRRLATRRRGAYTLATTMRTRKVNAADFCV